MLSGRKNSCLLTSHKATAKECYFDSVDKEKIQKETTKTEKNLQKEKNKKKKRNDR